MLQHSLIDTALLQATCHTETQDQARRQAWLQEVCGYPLHEGPG